MNERQQIRSKEIVPCTLHLFMIAGLRRGMNA
jgi:hypothetical protein